MNDDLEGFITGCKGVLGHFWFLKYRSSSARTKIGETGFGKATSKYLDLQCRGKRWKVQNQPSDVIDIITAIRQNIQTPLSVVEKGLAFAANALTNWAIGIK